MIRQFFSAVIAIALTTLLALGAGQRDSTHVQTLSGSQPVTPDITLEITTLDLLGTNTLIAGWTLKKTGSVTIQPYEIRLELSRNGVTERLVKTANAEEQNL